MARAKERSHRAVTVIARLKPDADVAALHTRLFELGRRMARDKQLPGDPDFNGIDGLHFLRLLIIKDPDLGEDRRRLLFAAVIDGHDEAGFLRRLLTAMPDPGAIWGACEGYPGADDFDTFLKFIRANSHEPEAFYIAFKRETVADHRRYDQMRCRWNRLDADRAVEALDAPPPWRRRPFSWVRLARRWVRRLSRPITVVPQVMKTFRDGWRISRRCGFCPAWAAATTIVRGLNRFPGWRLFNHLTGNIEQLKKPRLSQVPISKQPTDAELRQVPGCLDPGSHLPPVEDRVVQNQLTLITPVANRARLNQLLAVLGAVDSYSRVWSLPGNLLGMSTIHFVRWMPIDDGRRLLMLSDYDHSWEAYIDEFIAMIRTGMDAIWSSASRSTVTAYKTDPAGDYLPRYLVKGCGDAAAFKHFLRLHQANAHVFYSAYPRRTVLNTSEDRQRFAGVSPEAGDHEFYTHVTENSLNAEP